jgi:hypothetical protein
MKRISISLLFLMGAAASAWGDCAPNVKADLSRRFPDEQVRVLCGEAPPSYVGTPYGDKRPLGKACMTKTGDCELEIVGPMGAPCQCGGMTGLIKE